MRTFLLSRRLELLSLLFALAGILYEFAFAQLLSALLGGTLLQYALVIGIFTFSLGMAGILFERIPERFRSLRALFFVQFATCAVAVISHLFLELLFHLNLDTALPRGIAYVPALLIGVLTGLELPILLNAASSASHRSLLVAWDYAGMFLATVLFPLFLLPTAGIRGVTLVAAGINLLCAFFLARTGR